jgi:hypothetical protein
MDQLPLDLDTTLYHARIHPECATMRTTTLGDPPQHDPRRQWVKDHAGQAGQAQLRERMATLEGTRQDVPAQIARLLEG